MSIVAPAKTPCAVIQCPHPEIARVVNGAEMTNFILRQGSEPALLGPEELGAYIRAELERWAKLVKTAGV